MEARTEVFVDASAWIALLLQRDENHRKALALWKSLHRASARLVTSNLVVAETHAHLLSRLGHDAARRFLRSMLDGEVAELVWVDAELTESAAEGWVYRRPDHTFSLTDATSFEIMQRRDIGDALAFDRDFLRAGFRQVR